MKKFWFVFVILALVFSGGRPAAAAAQHTAPIIQGDTATIIPGRYIVVLKPGISSSSADKVIETARSLNATIYYRYRTALVGFAADLSDESLNTLAANSNVDYIEADQIITIDTTQPYPPSWGLDRADQHAQPLDNNYNYNYTGAGVHAYIIDTGIWVTHSDFGGRASVAYDAVGDGRNGIDCNGHGTHVAGTVGGNTYGIAKGVSLYAVRVIKCNGSGTLSAVVAGVDWVTANHVNPAVANMSLGGSPSSSLDTAVKNSINAGVTYTIAAGNKSKSACKYSPARVSTAITVGATIKNDTRATYSNFGRCLDLFAPGSNISSDWYGTDTATATASGTSMAAPHVAGVVALYLQAHPSASPAGVAAALAANATSGVVKKVGNGSPNLLLYSLIP